MKTVLIENHEANYSIDIIRDLIEKDELSNEYLIISKDVQLNFNDPELWFGVIGAVYTVIKIFEHGYEHIKELINNNNFYVPNDDSINVNDVQKEEKTENKTDYEVNIEDENVNIEIKKEDDSININIKNINNFVRDKDE